MVMSFSFWRKRPIKHSLVLIAALFSAITVAHGVEKSCVLRAGVAAVPITPFGANPEWDGPVTPSGIWGESFTDTNHNGRWDPGEPFTVDEASAAIDAHSRERYNGIYLAGFGNDRLATGKHDDLWARALVLDCGATRIAIVALDFVGYYAHAGYYGADEGRKLIDPSLAVQEILIASTHNHEGPDTIGLWGNNPASDGKFPRYLRFVDRQIARAITQAAQLLTPVRMKLGLTTPSQSPSLVNMQTRTDGRPPKFFDEELRVMQFVGTEGHKKDKTVGILVNWNTHPESLEDENTLLTSDFPGAVRDALEKQYGGTAVYVSGDLGAVEIVGDNNRSTRTRFDGRDFPVVAGNKAATFTFDRMQAIGRDVARAASEAIEHGEWSAVSTLEVRKTNFRMPMDNVGYQFLVEHNVLSAIPGFSDKDGPHATSTIYVIRLGDAQILTVPGELFPEVFYGVEKNRRRDCAASDTKRPTEPAVREAMTARYRFLFGLSPDELGYLVPGYDFRPPAFDPNKGMVERPDACASAGVPTHYHETNSASSQLAPAWACAAVELLKRQPSRSAACPKNVK